MPSNKGSKKQAKQQKPTGKRKSKAKENTKVTKNVKQTEQTEQTENTIVQEVNQESDQGEIDEQQLKLELITEEFDDLLASITEMKKRHAKEFSALVARTKQLRKNSLKDMKQMNRELGKKRKKKQNRKPCGFQSPAPISKQLAKFLGQEEGVEISRTKVTKQITQYVKKHGLQKPENKRVILPDTKLKKLLDPLLSDAGKELTYFNLQTYLVPHFPKSKNASKTKGKGKGKGKSKSKE